MLWNIADSCELWVPGVTMGGGPRGVTMCVLETEPRSHPYTSQYLK